MGDDEKGEQLASGAATAEQVDSSAAADAALGAATPPAPKLGARVRAWLTSEEGKETLIVLSLLGLCVLYRVLNLQPVEIWGDAAQKWHFARQLAYDNDFHHARWTHHMARFGVNIPAFFVQRIFGTYATAYYILPVAVFTAEVLLVYKLARRLSGRAAGVLGALFLICFTGANRSASQLLPDVFEATAAMVVAHFLVRLYEEEEGRKRLYLLIGVGLGFIWEYMIKESSVLILPGITLAVLLSKRRFKDVLILAAIVASYVALETAGFSLFTPYSHRMAIVQVVHGSYPAISFWQLFERYTKLEAPWQMLFWMWVPTVFWHFGSRDRRMLPTLLLPLGFLFFLTFLVRSINPIHQWTAFKSRYIVIVGPFFVLGVALFVTEAARRIGATYGSQRWQPWLARAETWSGPLTLGCCSVLALATLLANGSLRSYAISNLRYDAAVLNDAYRRNLPIIERNVSLTDGERYARGLSTAYAVYFSDKYLSQSTRAKPGWLPDIQEGVRLLPGRQFLGYMLRDEAAYRDGEMLKLIKAGCAAEVYTKGSRIVVEPRGKLPEHCKAPSGAVLPR